MTAAAIYTRISKDSVGLGLGVDRQERECRELAARHKLAVAEVFVDNDISAYSGRRRPGYRALLDAIRDGRVRTVIAWHPDRLTRSVRELEDLVDLLEGSGVDVITVTAGTYDLHTPSGRMTARIIGATARYESEHKAERLRAKSDELARTGRPPGGRTPYGFLPGYVGHDAGEADALRYMARRVLEGASLLTVARELDARGIGTKEGRAWHHSTVRAVLLNPAVAGLRIHRREVAGPASWEAIVDRDTWEQVRGVLADPARKRARPAQRYLLAGLVTNAAVAPMNGRPDRGRRTYSTRSGDDGPPVSINADQLEDHVVTLVLAALDDAVVPAGPVGLADGGDGDVERLEAELGELARLRGEGVVSLPEWLAAREPLQARLTQARAEVSARSRPSLLRDLLDGPGAVRTAWPRLALTDQREIVREIVERVVVAPSGRNRWAAVAGRVTMTWRV